VLGREQADQSRAAEIAEELGRVGEPTVHRRLVGQQREAPATEERGAAVNEHLEAGLHARHPARY